MQAHISFYESSTEVYDIELIKLPSGVYILSWVQGSKEKRWEYFYSSVVEMVSDINQQCINKNLIDFLKSHLRSGEVIK